MDPSHFSIAFVLATVIFTAGGTYYAFRRLKKDVDGVGRKVNQLQAERQADKENTLIAFLLTCPEPEREKLARLLKG